MPVSVRRTAETPHPASLGPVPGGPAGPAWTGIPLGTGTVAVAERDALGTTARAAVWPPEDLAAALAAVDAELAQLDRLASRFRADSELSRIHRMPGMGHWLSRGLAEAVRVALAAAGWTGGLVDPTVGGALVALGYDRDFAAIGAGPQLPVPGPGPAPGWRSVSLDGAVLRLPAGVWLDLGATAKGLGADRAAAAAGRALGGGIGRGRALGRGGVLVSLGGDIAVAGLPPLGGWPVSVADSSDPGSGPGGGPGQVVRLAAGGLATSSVTGRRWQWAGRPVHHIIDPRTGFPADGPWRTASVAAASCAEANAASTAAIVAGRDAEAWLARTRLPARLTSHDGAVRLLGGWPAAAGAPLPGPLSSRLPAGGRP
jgi:FAD:protein FMN transferase